ASTTLPRLEPVARVHDGLAREDGPRRARLAPSGQGPARAAAAVRAAQVVVDSTRRSRPAHARRGRGLEPRARGAAVARGVLRQRAAAAVDRARRPESRRFFLL